MTQDRPSVDPTVYDLAERWLRDYPTIADREDLIWELADDIQQAIEGFLETAIDNRRMRDY